MQPDSLDSCHALPAVQRAELLDRQCPRHRRRALVAARHARDPVRAQPLLGDQAQSRRRAEHPQRPPPATGRARTARAPADGRRRRVPRVRGDAQGQGLSARSCPPCCAGATTTPSRREDRRASRCTFPAATTRTRGCTAATAGSRSVPASCSRAPGRARARSRSPTASCRRRSRSVTSPRARRRT